MIVQDQIIEIAGVPNYLARSATPTTAGVLLLPHVYGVDDFVRGFADGLAKRGLTTVAWNPYPKLPMGQAFTERPERATDEAVMQTLSKCMDAMRSELGVTEVATIGFCMGARYVLLWGAREKRLRAAVATYASVPAKRNPGQDLEPVAAAAAIECPVQLIYPGEDRVTPRHVFTAIQAMLQGRPVETSILYYPGAEHGFMHAPSPVNDAATRSAVPQIYAFLETHLAAK